MDAELMRGRYGRVFNARLYSNDDLVESVEQLCNTHQVLNAFVRGGLGSLFRAELQAGDTVRHIDGFAVELLTLQGDIRPDPGTGKACATLHGVVADNLGTVHAGQFLRGGSPACVTIELVVQEWLPEP